MERRARLLVIDDEPQIRDLLSNIFSDRHDVLTAEDGNQGIALARSESPDLILLDVRMPGLSGYTVCESLQSIEATRRIPIIMLTAMKETEDRVRAFNAGADEFLGKPFSIDELVARVDGKLRKRQATEAGAASETIPASAPAPSSGKITCGNVVLNPEAFLVLIAGQEVHLSMLEFNLLRHFVENRDKLLSRENIIDAVWKEKGVAPRALDWHILSLRKKLANADLKISTVYGGGYILKSREAGESR